MDSRRLSPDTAQGTVTRQRASRRLREAQGRHRPGPCHLQGNSGDARGPYLGRERRAWCGGAVHLHDTDGRRVEVRLPRCARPTIRPDHAASGTGAHPRGGIPKRGGWGSGSPLGKPGCDARAVISVTVSMMRSEPLTLPRVPSASGCWRAVLDVRIRATVAPPRVTPERRACHLADAAARSQGVSRSVRSAGP